MMTNFERIVSAVDALIEQAGVIDDVAGNQMFHDDIPEDAEDYLHQQTAIIRGLAREILNAARGARDDEKESEVER